MHYHVAEPRIVPMQRDFVSVDQDELSLNRIPAIVIGTDAHLAAEWRILVEWI
jgi:hypothetical protein